MLFKNCKNWIRMVECSITGRPIYPDNGRELNGMKCTGGISNKHEVWSLTFSALPLMPYRLDNKVSRASLRQDGKSNHILQELQSIYQGSYGWKNGVTQSRTASAADLQEVWMVLERGTLCWSSLRWWWCTQVPSSLRVFLFTGSYIGTAHWTASKRSVSKRSVWTNHHVTWV